MNDVIETIGKYARIPSYPGKEALAIEELEKELKGDTDLWIDDTGNLHALREGGKGKKGKLMIVTHVDKFPLAFFGTCEGYAIGKLDNSVGVGIAVHTIKNYPRDAHTLEMVGTIGHEEEGFRGAKGLTRDLTKKPDKDLKGVVVIDTSGSYEAEEGKGPIIYKGAGIPFQKRITKAAAEVAKKMKIRKQIFFPGGATNDATVLARTRYPVVALEVLVDNLHGLVETGLVSDIENLYELFRGCTQYLVPYLDKFRNVEGYENRPMGRRDRVLGADEDF